MDRQLSNLIPVGSLRIIISQSILNNKNLDLEILSESVKPKKVRIIQIINQKVVYQSFINPKLQKMVFIIH